MIRGVIGDIRRCSSPNKPLAFASLDSSVVYKSGNFRAKVTHMSKRGSHILGYALTIAFLSLCRQDCQGYLEDAS